MVKQIAFVVEGEEDPRDTRDEMKLRKSFHRFFNELDELANARGIRLQFRLYGSRRASYEKFCLLVDSEDPVDCQDPLQEPGACWEHLKNRPADRWEKPAGAGDEQCQLMVQAIEAWLLADPEALSEFYGRKGFRKNSLPPTQNVEEIPKAKHLPSLTAATKDTQKGEYHKVKHLSPLLFHIDAKKVRSRAPFCDRIVVTLRRKIEGSS